MADKRILIISVAILCIVALGAFILLNGGSGGIGIEDDTPNEVTIDGITFNIPEGYKEVNVDDLIEKEESNTGVRHSKTFVNYETGDDFLIAVTDYGDDEVTEDDLIGTPKTINGHKGAIYKGEFVHFSYPENGDLVQVSANESLFEQIIPYKTVEKTTEEKSTSSSSSSSSYSSSSSTSGSSSSDYSSVFVKNVLEDYDLNGDGGLSSSEWDYWCSREGYAPMSDCDSNGDGFCSQSELATYSHDFGY